MAGSFYPGYLPAQIIDALFGNFAAERQVIIVTKEGCYVILCCLFDLVAIKAVATVS